MTWVTSHPPAAVDLDRCVTCGLCLPVCPTFRLTGDESASPRGRLTAIDAVGRGLAVVDERFDEITSFCLQCRACETACPSLVPYGTIIESARAEAVARVPHRGLRWERIALGRVVGRPVLIRLVSLVIALAQRLGVLRWLPRFGDLAVGLRPIPVPLPSARGGSWGDPSHPRVALFTGCVADAWFPDTHRASIELLVRAGYRVEAVSSQTCCGALAAHAGHEAEATRLALRNIAALEGATMIAVDVAGCGAHLETYGRFGVAGSAVAEASTDITEIIAGAISDGRLPRLPPTGERIAVQDPCHLEHGQRLTEAPYRIIEAAGYDAIAADAGGLCCGAAGAYQAPHPSTGETLGRAKAKRVVATSAEIVASANAGCEMQLRRFLGEGTRIAHPVEIYHDRLAAFEKGRAVGHVPGSGGTTR